MNPQKKSQGLFITIVRYLTVGVAAASTQFSILALLVELTDTDPTIASGIGFFIATMLNYVLQHTWTFQSDQKHRDAFLRYCAVTSMTMCINLLLFWTLTAVLKLWYLFSQFTTTAVIAFLNFIMNRHFTFNSAFVISDFRNRFVFDKKGHATKTLQILTMSGLAIAIRFFYMALHETSHVAETGTLAWLWGNWLSSIGLNASAANIIPSFIPGILLPIPVIAIARTVYDERIAWIASLFIISHPRMVEYSCSGSSIMLPLFLFSAAIAFWTLAYTRDYPLLCLFLSGAFFGFCLGDMIEPFFAFLCCLALESILPFTSEKFDKPFFRLSLLTAGYLAAYFLLLRVHPLPFQFNTNWSWNFSQAINLFPGIILSPVFVFVMILPIFAARSHIHTAAELPLIVMLFLSLTVYTADPSTGAFLPALIPIHIFGSAGLVAFCTWAAFNIFKTTVVKSRYLVVPILTIFFFASTWIAIFP